MSILLGVVLGILLLACLITFGAWMRAHRLLADVDRARVTKLINLVEELLLGAEGDRVLTKGVAEDLKKSHGQADLAHGKGPTGTAADAGARTPPEKEK